MNVRIRPRSAPSRTDLYGGVVAVYSNGATLILSLPEKGCSVRVPLKAVAEILLDDEPGDWW